MRRLLLMAVLVAGCGVSGGSPSLTLQATAATAAPTATTTPKATVAPAPTADPAPVRDAVAALDLLQTLVNDGADGNATGQWAIDAAKTLGASGKLDSRLASFAENLAALLTAVSDGTDQTAAIQVLLAQRASLADLIGGIPTPAPTEVARRDLKVAESGFTAFGGGTPYAQYGVVVENPNKSGWVATNISVQIAYFNAAGNVVTTEDESLTNVLPGQRSAVGGTTFDTAGAKTIAIDLTVGEWQQVDFDLGRYSVSKVTLKSDTYSTRITGILSCTFTTDPTNTKVVAILRNAGKKVIGGESAYLDVVHCGKGSPFAIETLQRMLNARSASIFAD